MLDTGCCGMAGSFGYTKERYDLSMKIGDLTLFPAVRKAGSREVCAPGTSCRHQIYDGTGTKASLKTLRLFLSPVASIPTKLS